MNVMWTELRAPVKSVRVESSRQVFVTCGVKRIRVESWSYLVVDQRWRFVLTLCYAFTVVDSILYAACTTNLTWSNWRRLTRSLNPTPRRRADTHLQDVPGGCYGKCKSATVTKSAATKISKFLHFATPESASPSPQWDTVTDHKLLGYLNKVENEGNCGPEDQLCAGFHKPCFVVRAEQTAHWREHSPSHALHEGKEAVP